jgi:hypothetical protein
MLLTRIAESAGEREKKIKNHPLEKSLNRKSLFSMQLTQPTAAYFAITPVREHARGCQIAFEFEAERKVFKNIIQLLWH